jgi:hypothetical protein
MIVVYGQSSYTSYKKNEDHILDKLSLVVSDGDPLKESILKPAATYRK